MYKPLVLLRRIGIFAIKILFWIAVWIALSFLSILGISLFHISEDEIILNGYETLILVTVPILLCVLLGQHLKKVKIRNSNIAKDLDLSNIQTSEIQDCVSKQQREDTSSCLTTINQAVNEVRESEKSLEMIDSLDGYEFERWCAALLSRHGYTKVSLTKETGDQGVDILAEREGIRYAIQCKCYSRDLGNTPIQEVNAGKTFYNCQIGVVMTNRYFTKGAKELAKSTGILLWDRDWLSTHNLPVNECRNEVLSQRTHDGGQHDELLWDAWSIISEAQMASVTLLERRLRIGYARASRIIDELEDMGYIGPFRGSKPRDILK